MMTLRQRVFAIGGVLLAILVVIFLMLVWYSRREGDTEIVGDDRPVGTTTPPSELIGERTIADVIKPQAPTPVFSSEAEPDRLARQIAGIFVERFESRSSANDQQHIDRVEEFVTPQMWQWVRNQSMEQADAYNGITTDVIASRVTAISATAATVTFDAQQEISDQQGRRIEQRSGRVELVANGDGWLVNGFFWE